MLYVTNFIIGGDFKMVQYTQKCSGKPGPCLFKVEGRIMLAGMLNIAGISKHVIQHAGNARPVKFDKPLLTKEALDSLRGKLKKELGGQPWRGSRLVCEHLSPC